MGEFLGNLVLRVGLALSIVFAAIGLTFAAPSGFGQPEAAPAVAAASVAPVVAGYEAAPVAADRAPTSAASTQQAATLVALTTTVVLLAIFVILFAYRPRPGGVRASHR